MARAKVPGYPCHCGKELKTADDIEIYAVEMQNVTFCTHCGKVTEFADSYILCECRRIVPINKLVLKEGGFACPLCKSLFM